MTDQNPGLIRLQRPERQTLPLVVAVPHAGRNYGPEFMDKSRLSGEQARLTEDAFADELALLAPRQGAPLLTALFPRIWLDANRDASEIDPLLLADRVPENAQTFTANVRAGLGVVPRLLTGGVPIYPEPLNLAEIEARIELGWRPYHDKLLSLLLETKERFGVALLVDCHTMPTGRENEPPDIVLGDGFGQTAAPAIVTAAHDHFAKLGLRVTRNRPYAGGYTTKHYGHPETGIHALQIEIRRGLYMDERKIERLAGLESLKRHLGALLDRLGAVVLNLG